MLRYIQYKEPIQIMNRIILFYKYVSIANPESTRGELLELCQKLGLKGRVLLATEGINATLAGSLDSINNFISFMSAHKLFNEIDFKDSHGSVDDFPRLEIKVKKEIVKLGIDPDVLSALDGGTHLTPKEAHELIATNKNLVILDARNNYESCIGTFDNAIRPDIKNFREFPQYINENTDLLKDKEVLMYCTGGIRCERASAYVQKKGIAKKVYQITGGIHRYVEQFPDGFFKGKNYVFDNRISLKVTDDILGSCLICQASADNYYNCMNARCNKHFIGCDTCIEQLQRTCSERCSDLIKQGLTPKRPLGYRQTAHK
jgi:predicted sulfurtransferase